jgi:hypothetical protein
MITGGFVDDRRSIIDLHSAFARSLIFDRQALAGPSVTTLPERFDGVFGGISGRASESRKDSQTN